MFRIRITQAIFAAAFMLPGATAAVQTGANRNFAPARVWQATLAIPTYELGQPDPNPALLGGARGRPIYPYPMLDSVTDRRVTKLYKAVYLENEYLRVLQGGCT